MTWREFKEGLLDYCNKHSEKKYTMASMDEAIKEYQNKKDKFTVYLGYSRKDKNKKNVIYVGTTIQFPLSRWYYHSTHGKNLNFEVIARFDNEQDMLQLEYDLIQKFHPSCNKITDRIQNFNVCLTEQVLEQRKRNKEWCQKCLRRRVSKGYELCFWCANGLC